LDDYSGASPELTEDYFGNYFKLPRFKNLAGSKPDTLSSLILVH